MKAKKKFKRHPANIAFDKFKKTYAPLFTGAGIGVSKINERFLENRMLHAFMAGFDSEKKRIVHSVNKNQLPKKRVIGFNGYNIENGHLGIINDQVSVVSFSGSPLGLSNVTKFIYESDLIKIMEGK